MGKLSVLRHQDGKTGGGGKIGFKEPSLAQLYWVFWNGDGKVPVQKKDFDHFEPSSRRRVGSFGTYHS